MRFLQPENGMKEVDKTPPPPPLQIDADANPLGSPVLASDLDSEKADYQ